MEQRLHWGMCWGSKLTAASANPGQKVPGQWHSQSTCPLGHVWLCTRRCGTCSWQHVLLPGPAVHPYPTPQGGLRSNAILPMFSKDGNPSHSCHFALLACPDAILGSPGRSPRILARPSGSPGMGGGGTGTVPGGVPGSLLRAGDRGDSSGRSGLVLTPAGAAAHGRSGMGGTPPASSGTAAGSGCAGQGQGPSPAAPRVPPACTGNARQLLPGHPQSCPELCWGVCTPQPATSAPTNLLLLPNG